METIKITCPCLFGLESVLAYEIRKIGGENIQSDNGKVTFEGTLEHIVLANIHLRTAERVLILMGEFKAESFEDLFQGVKAIDWKQFIGKRDAFPVKGWSINSKLYSIPDCQKIVKKAMVENLKEIYDIPWFEESGTTYQIQFSILKDTVQLMIDTSGAGLHKRGYRRNSVEAPIKETLAAGIVDLARIKKDSVVYDPMCGSGTILIEAAMKALNIAPGINRHFASERFKQLPRDMWEKARRDAIDAIDRTATFKGFGYDMDGEAVEISIDNSKQAGVGTKIKIEQAVLSDFYPELKDATVITNPPYGERLLDKKEAERVYKTLGHMRRNYKNLKCYIISPDERFEDYFGEQARKRRKLYNGMIKCQVYMYFSI